MSLQVRQRDGISRMCDHAHDALDLLVTGSTSLGIGVSQEPCALATPTASGVGIEVPYVCQIHARVMRLPCVGSANVQAAVRPPNFLIGALSHSLRRHVIEIAACDAPLIDV